MSFQLSDQGIVNDNDMKYIEKFYGVNIISEKILDSTFVPSIYTGITDFILICKYLDNNPVKKLVTSRNELIWWLNQAISIIPKHEYESGNTKIECDNLLLILVKLEELFLGTWITRPLADEKINYFAQVKYLSRWLDTKEFINVFNSSKMSDVFRCRTNLKRFLITLEIDSYKIFLERSQKFIISLIRDFLGELYLVQLFNRTKDFLAQHQNFGSLLLREVTQQNLIIREYHQLQLKTFISKQLCYRKEIEHNEFGDRALIYHIFLSQCMESEFRLYLAKCYESLVDSMAKNIEIVTCEVNKYRSKSKITRFLVHQKQKSCKTKLSKLKNELRQLKTSLEIIKPTECSICFLHTEEKVGCQVCCNAICLGCYSSLDQCPFCRCPYSSRR